DLEDQGSRVAVEIGLMAELGIVEAGRIVADGRARIRRRDALARRQLGCHAIAGRLGLRRDDGRRGRYPDRPDAEIRTHGSLLVPRTPLRNHIPIQSREAYCSSGLNVLLGNMVNGELA